MTARTIHGDCLSVLRDYPDAHFTAACFSPPYDVGAKAGFDVRTDFRQGGAFIPYALEISRVSMVWAINLAQRVDAGRNLPFIEELVLTLESQSVQLFDRWVVRKPVPRPRRGERALVDMEFVYLFTAYPDRVRKRPGDAATTVLDVRSHRPSTVKTLGATPYYPQIPWQVFRLYGGAGPVLDPFCGTGTSLVAAIELDREATGIELHQDIWRSCRERVSAAQRARQNRGAADVRPAGSVPAHAG